MSLNNTSSSEVVVTGVDALVELLKKTGQISVPDAAKKLKYPVDTIQSWVDFLVEEKIIGIEYNLTTPSIHLINQQGKDKKNDLKKEFNEYKKDFQNNSKRKNGSGDNPGKEWKNHISFKLDALKHFFFAEAEKRELKDPDKLWEEYKQKTIMD